MIWRATAATAAGDDPLAQYYVKPEKRREAPFHRGCTVPGCRSVDDRTTPYGIFECRSLFVMHVCPDRQSIFVMRTARVRAAIERLGLNETHLRPVHWEGQLRGWGYAVLFEDLPGLVEVHLPKLRWKDWPKSDDTSVKGGAAERVALVAVRRRLIPFDFSTTGMVWWLEEAAARQIAGIDLNGLGRPPRGFRHNIEVTVQVKADLPAAKHLRLFFQTHEWNPGRKT
jgi:hypothetical protein